VEADAIEWIRRRWQEEALPEPDHFAAMAALLRTHQTVAAAMDKILRGQNLSRTGYLLMSTLRMSRSHTRPLGQLSKHLIVHPTTVTLVIDQLEKRDLVSRAPHPTDRRDAVLGEGGEHGAAVDKASGELAAAGFGLPDVSPQLTIALTEILRQVRGQIGDIA